MDVMTKLLFLVLFLVVPLSFAKTLTIGTTTQNPPFSSLADQKDHFYGFDIDIMGAICQRLKLQCQLTPLVFNDLFTALATHKIDLAIGAIVITESEEKQFLFSLPYLESNAQFITKQLSSIKKSQDILNKKVGVRRGTPFKNLALTLYHNQITIREFAEIDDLLNALSTDAIDVILTNAAAAKYWYSNNSNNYKLIGSQIPTGHGYGIMANLDQGKLIADINATLLKMEADGTYLDIFTRYFDN